MKADPASRCGHGFILNRGVHPSKTTEFFVIGRKCYLIRSFLAHGNEISVKGFGGMEIKDKHRISFGIDDDLILLMQPSVHCRKRKHSPWLEQFDHSLIKRI